MIVKDITRQLLQICAAMVAGGLLCSCTAVRPLQTVESARQFDYDGMVLAGHPDRGLALAISQSEAGGRVINVMLKNEGERRLCINSRFVLDLGQYDASPNLTIVVERASNSQKVPVVKTSWTKGGRGPEARWFKYLEPYEYFKTSLNLDEYFSLERGEQYRISVEYNNQESGYQKGQWVEMYAWVGRIQSNKLLLK